ncbi:MAG TPA: carbohydrate kinase family protein [Steroidobacteraceae bacterium]|nr:carbohydrate kinase family protein [Steroidobacteraceae bacterium]
MTALICGSMAYDTVMMFEGRFRDHILADKLHMINVSFLAPAMRRNFGGCAGNIAYNLKLLGGDGLIMATVGHDFAAYADWLDRCGVARTHVRIVQSEFTAQAYITTDLDNNQITAFHPGAMNHSQLNRVSDSSGVKLGIVAPDGREGMLEHAVQFAEAGLPYLFDPGQGLPMFGGAELRHFIERAAWVAVNDYEASLLSERTGWSLEQIASRVRALIVTRGAEGSWIFVGRERLEIPVAVAARVADPTGCGDAYRAGLLFGLERGLDWATTGRIAALLAAIKIEHHGTQQHRLTQDEFKQRFHAAFGYAL